MGRFISKRICLTPESGRHQRGISVSRVGGNTQIKAIRPWLELCDWIWRSIAIWRSRSLEPAADKATQAQLHEAAREV
jgi:F0F1-type ATP synthase alpha subunit